MARAKENRRRVQTINNKNSKKTLENRSRDQEKKSEILWTYKEDARAQTNQENNRMGRWPQSNNTLAEDMQKDLRTQK